MADIFISYSRRDEDVRPAAAGIARRARQGRLGRPRGHRPAVEWRREIELGIEGADIFAFVISPRRAPLRGLRPRARLRGGEEEADRAAASPRARRRPGARRPRRAATTSSSAPTRSSRPASPRCSRRSTTCPSGRASTRACSSGPRNGSTAAGTAARCSAASDLREAETWLGSRRRTRSRSRRRCRPSTSWPAAGRRPGASGSRSARSSRRAGGRRDRGRRRAPASRRAAASASGRRGWRSRGGSPRRPISQLQIDPELSILLARAGGLDQPDGRGRAGASPGAGALARRDRPPRPPGVGGHAAFSPDGDARGDREPRRPRRALGRARPGESIAWLGHATASPGRPSATAGDLVATASRDRTGADLGRGHRRAAEARSTGTRTT